MHRGEKNAAYQYFLQLMSHLVEPNDPTNIHMYIYIHIYNCIYM